MPSCADILYDRIHNEKWFTARGLKTISDASGWHVESVNGVAKLIALLLLFLLTRSSNWLVCNTILIVVPLLLTFVYPDEKPPPENMRIYGICALAMTAFDRMLEAFPFYYVIKLSALLFLLVEPSFLNDNIRKLLTVPVASANPTGPEERNVKTAKPAAPWSILDSLRSAIAPSSPKARSLRGPAPPPKPVEDLRQSNATLDTRPLMAGPTQVPMSESIGRASVASGPPVAVGEKKSVPSTYINLPKPKVGRRSIRLPPDKKK
ncbi:unnamed protein product [Cylicocyclus nassatus]|uniref:Uncharacterized protein n=1 Tax=Cylicocyclus nassatus TaxID=53992 RepID=A0AA36MB39_CYLNA|nr:unnamed protein product [Cylicocyclus nassatus]